MGKIQIIKDGSVQGWAVSLFITIVTLFAFIVSMVSDTVAERFGKVGGSWAAIVIGQFTAWLAYRAYSSGHPAPPLSRNVKTAQQAVRKLLAEQRELKEK